MNTPAESTTNSPGQCDTLIVHCMDFRIQPAIGEWIRSNELLGQVDRVAFAGPCRDPEKVMDFVQVAYEKHGVTRVLLTQHDDCAAYGGSDAFASQSEERSRLFADMHDLRVLIAERFSNVQITSCLIVRDGDNWRLEELAGQQTKADSESQQPRP